VPCDVCLSALITGLCWEEGLSSIEPSHTQTRSASECGLSGETDWNLSGETDWNLSGETDWNLSGETDWKHSAIAHFLTKPA